MTTKIQVHTGRMSAAELVRWSSTRADTVAPIVKVHGCDISIYIQLTKAKQENRP